MNKRQYKKHEKAARRKVVSGEPLTPSERVAFKRSMEVWLGNNTVRQIRTLFGGA